MMRKIFTITFFLLIVWIGGLFYFGYSINHYQTDTSSHTDAIIVLTGGRNRIAEASKLLNKKMADKLFISGVDKNTNLKNIQKTKKIKQSSMRDIEIGRQATDTESNAEETLSWVNSHHIASIRLVTSNYHMPRSMLEFRHLMPEIEIIMHPVYSERIEKKWWTSWQTFSLIFKEYNKFIFKLIQYQLQP